MNLKRVRKGRALLQKHNKNRKHVSLLPDINDPSCLQASSSSHRLQPGMKTQNRQLESSQQQQLHTEFKYLKR